MFFLVVLLLGWIFSFWALAEALQGENLMLYERAMSWLFEPA